MQLSIFSFLRNASPGSCRFLRYGFSLGGLSLSSLPSAPSASRPLALLAVSPSLNGKTLVGSNGLGPSTSRLSGVCSNQLSYEPI